MLADALSPVDQAISMPSGERGAADSRARLLVGVGSRQRRHRRQDVFSAASLSRRSAGQRVGPWAHYAGDRAGLAVVVPRKLARLVCDRDAATRTISSRRLCGTCSSSAASPRSFATAEWPRAGVIATAPDGAQRARTSRSADLHRTGCRDVPRPGSRAVAEGAVRRQSERAGRGPPQPANARALVAATIR
jgi:hypothetical protein